VNRLTLAVAGGRKTQSIIDACSGASAGRILVLTYTQANQHELRQRLGCLGPIGCTVEVRGWFSFLMAHWVRPYLPLQFADRRLRGLNFEGDPGRYATGERRFLDPEMRAYKRHLAKLACDVSAASQGAVLDRLRRVYDAIYVDEVQDLNGYDLEILDALMGCELRLDLVGDVRQAIIQTNVQDPKNKQFRGVRIKDWFEKQRAAGRLLVEHQTRTWRSNQAIADFADSIFDSSWGFAPTTSMNNAVTGHDGLFAVAPSHATAYLDEFEPLCLRHSVASGNAVALPYANIGVAKGLEADRVLIWPTQPMIDFLRAGSELAPTSACELYVAATRARASVAFVCDRPERLGLPVWKPH
jgi:DNA helicase II / ATP-dependent DNA helicase PcrA